MLSFEFQSRDGLQASGVDSASNSRLLALAARSNFPILTDYTLDSPNRKYSNHIRNAAAVIMRMATRKKEIEAPTEEEIEALVAGCGSC